MKQMLISLFILVGLAVNLIAFTLDDCLELVKKNNKELLQAKEDIYMADALYYDVRGSLLPQLSLQGGYQLKTTWLPDSAIPPKQNFVKFLSGNSTQDDSTLAGILTGFANGMIPFNPKKEGSFATQLQLNQIIFSGGRLINGINAVGRYRSIQKLRYQLLEQELVLKTTDMFYQTLLAKKVYEVQNEALQIANKHFERVQLFHEEGQVSDFDVLRAKLEVAKLKPQVVQAQNMYDLALSALKKQIGLKDENSEPEGAFILPDTVLVTLNTAQEEALKQRIELKLAAINTEIQNIKYNAEKDNYLPNIALTANYALYTAADEYKIESNDFGTAFSIGIGFQIPLFTGFSNTSKRSYAKHNYQQAQLVENNAQEMIELEVKQAYQNLQHALENYQVQLENIKLAEKSLELAQVRYENQVGIQLEVFDAQILLNSIKLSYYKSIYEVISAKQKLNKAMGYKI